MLTLWETHRKNTQEKDKNDRDHIRQVHAERRSRYAKAIEHIADDKAVVRLGGIYTLVSLVDEWLTDESIKDIDDRRKEGQVIVNNLCAYIRSPFHLAEKRDILELDSRPAKYKGDFAADQAEFFEECNVRKSIFEEINKRITVKIDENNINEREAVGSWSKFIFNFDAAPIFYFLQYLTYVNSSFHAAKFYGRTFFSNSHFFGGTDFTDAVFYGPADFNDTFLLVTHFFVGQNLMARHHFKLYSRKKLILKMQNSSNRQNLYLHSLMMPPILRMFIFHKSQYSQSTYILITITPRIAITFMHHFHTKLIPQNIISWFLRKASFQSLAVIYPSKIITTRFQKVP